jgi:hypothetical protein
LQVPALLKYHFGVMSLRFSRALRPIHLFRKGMLLVTLAGFAAGCGESRAQTRSEQAKATAPREQPKPAAPEEGKTGPAMKWEKLVMHAVRDQQGNVTSEMPFPASWKIMSSAKRGEPSIVGPNHIEVIDFPLQNFTFPLDPRMQSAYVQSGQRMRAMPGAERVVKEDLVPYCAGQGLQFVRQYEVPEITRIDKSFNEMLYKAVPMRTEFIAIGTEWKHTNGRSFFMITHLSSSTTRELQMWGYYSNGLKGEDAVFETAKKQLIFGLANTRFNPEPIMAYNRSEAEKAGRSWSEFNARMARNWAAFETSQRDFVNRSSAINESIMAGWRESNAISDRTQERFIDTINERENRVNPNTGERFKVDSTPNQYWVNGNGQYISVSNPGYDPNLDKNLNHHNWDQLQPAK